MMPLACALSAGGRRKMTILVMTTFLTFRDAALTERAMRSVSRETMLAATLLIQGRMADPRARIIVVLAILQLRCRRFHRFQGRLSFASLRFSLSSSRWLSLLVLGIRQKSLRWMLPSKQKALAGKARMLPSTRRLRMSTRARKSRISRCCQRAWTRKRAKPSSLNQTIRAS